MDSGHKPARVVFEGHLQNLALSSPSDETVKAIIPEAGGE